MSTLRWGFVLLSSAVLVSFGILMVNQTAQVVDLADRVDPRLGTVLLWSVVVFFVTVLGSVAVLFLRLPKPLRPPEKAEGPEFERYLARLRQRLAMNPRVPVGPLETRADIERAISVLHAEAEQKVQKDALRVFFATAISQSGKLDAIVVIAMQARLVWHIARLYYQRPTARDVISLYANLAASAFVAGEIDDVNLEELVNTFVQAQAPGLVGAVPGLTATSTALVNSLTSGTANALLTLRVGFIADQYCAALVTPERRVLRRTASLRAVALLPALLGGAITTVAKSFGRAARSGVSKSASGAASGVRRAGSKAAEHLRFRRRDDGEREKEPETEPKKPSEAGPEDAPEKNESRDAPEESSETKVPPPPGEERRPKT